MFRITHFQNICAHFSCMSRIESWWIKSEYMQFQSKWLRATMMMMETTATLTVGCFGGSDGGDGRQCICRCTTTTMCVLCRLSSSAGDIRFRWNIGAINKYIAYLWAANIKRRSIKLILIIWPVHHSNWCMLFISSYRQLNSVQHNQWQRIIEHFVNGHRRKT